MTDRLRDAAVGVLLFSLLLALPDVSAGEGRISLGLAALLVLAAAWLLARRSAPGRAHRILFLAAVLFLKALRGDGDHLPQEADDVLFPTFRLVEGVLPHGSIK